VHVTFHVTAMNQNEVKIKLKLWEPADIYSSLMTYQAQTKTLDTALTRRNK